MREIFEEADANGDGYLDYTELLGFVRRREEEIAQAFARLTPRGTFTHSTQDLSFADLKKALTNLGVSASDPSLSHAKKYNKPWEKANELFVDRYGKPFVDDTDEFLQKIMKETEEAPMFDK